MGCPAAWCGKRDLNPHALRHRLLRPACLPFHHSRLCGRHFSVSGRGCWWQCGREITKPEPRFLEAVVKEGSGKDGRDLLFLWDGYQEKASDRGKTVYIYEFLRSRSKSLSSFSLTRIRAGMYFALRKNTSIHRGYEKG